MGSCSCRRSRRVQIQDPGRREIEPLLWHFKRKWVSDEDASLDLLRALLLKYSSGNKNSAAYAVDRARRRGDYETLARVVLEDAVPNFKRIDEEFKSVMGRLAKILSVDTEGDPDWVVTLEKCLVAKLKNDLEKPAVVDHVKKTFGEVARHIRAGTYPPSGLVGLLERFAHPDRRLNKLGTPAYLDNIVKNDAVSKLALERLRKGKGDVTDLRVLHAVCLI